MDICLNRARHLVIGRTHAWGGLIVAGVCAALLATIPRAATATDVEIVLQDFEPTHVHPPGRPLRVEVIARATQAGARVFYHWMNGFGAPLTPATELPLNRRIRLDAPGQEVGYYGLRFSSPDERVRFPPQGPGSPIEFGFSILASSGRDDRAFEPASPFGMIHGNLADPHLRGYVKTMTWHHTPKSFVERLSRVRAAGLLEVPLIHGEGWVSKTHDRALVTGAELDAISRKLGAILDALLEHDVAVPALWQVGLESNKGDMLAKPFFLQNFDRKLARIAEVFAQKGVERQNFRLMANFRGDYNKEYREFARSPAARRIDVFSFNPYRWPDFPSPDEWLPGFIGDLDKVFEGKPLMIGELGIPVRGNMDPDGFFGYPRKKQAIPGASPSYASRYLVKAHVLALASRKVERVFLYNYQNRGNDIHYAEDHFGLRSFAPKDERRRLGLPLPAYNAYVTMLQRLAGKQLHDVRSDADGVRVFEFRAGTNAESRCILAWTQPGRKRLVRLASILGELDESLTVEIVDLFGTPRAPGQASVVLDEDPVYFTVNRSGQH